VQSQVRQADLQQQVHRLLVLRLAVGVEQVTETSELEEHPVWTARRLSYVLAATAEEKHRLVGTVVDLAGGLLLWGLTEKKRNSFEEPTFLQSFAGLEVSEQCRRELYQVWEAEKKSRWRHQTRRLQCCCGVRGVEELCQD
jgi:hypothetical protein